MKGGKVRLALILLGSLLGGCAGNSPRPASALDCQLGAGARGDETMMRKVECDK